MSCVPWRQHDTDPELRLRGPPGQQHLEGPVLAPPVKGAAGRKPQTQGLGGDCPWSRRWRLAWSFHHVPVRPSPANGHSGEGDMHATPTCRARAGGVCSQAAPSP